MAAIILDIETGANSLAAQIVSLMSFKAKSNIKDPVKIEADIANKKKAAIDKAALWWGTGMVGQISASNLTGTAFFSENIGTMKTEKVLLESFMAWLDYAGSSETLGQKAHTFDKPYIIGRCMFYEIPIHASLKPYRTKDLDDIFGGSYSSQTNTLHNYSVAMGWPGKPTDSALMPGYFAAGDYTTPQTQCDDDQEKTRLLFARFLA